VSFHYVSGTIALKRMCIDGILSRKRNTLGKIATEERPRDTPNIKKAARTLSR